MAVSTLAEFEQHRREVDTARGPAGVVDVGEGRPAVFVHGVGTSAHLWRKVIDRVGAGRRCIAIDLPGHGSSPVRPGQDVSLGGLADFVTATCDALRLDPFDLVANDTGGAVAQIVAARAPERLRTFTLTNCETHDRVPPKAFRSTVLLARAGLFAPLTRAMLGRSTRGARRGYLAGYQDPTELSDELVRAWAEPVYGSLARARQFQRLLAGLRPDDLLAVEPRLATLSVPTLLVWGTGDRFFPISDARWLRELVPGVRELVEVPGARLFFPDEHPDALAGPLLRHWAATADQEPQRATASGASTAPIPGAAGTATQPSAPTATGSASRKSRRAGVQPGGS
jgi:pimeloyl-ACP methyl ester carboxylesterase